MQTKLTDAICATCNGEGLVPSLRSNECWKSCRDCVGIGRGETVWIVHKSRQQSDRKFAFEQVIGGRFHTNKGEDFARDHANFVFGFPAFVSRES